MNAVRVYVRELARPVVKDNPRLLAEYCDAISILVDFLQDMLVHYPKWGEFSAPFSPFPRTPYNIQGVTPPGTRRY